jgi:ATP-dependent helicase/nuclease subunit A
VRLARKIARQAAGWIGQGWQPRDIIVLVRQRGALFESVIRALKAADIPVAGADRLVLTEHIAVMDMMALADALLLPEDDLALATVLKSPLFGLSEDDLFTIAWDRKEPSLRAALATRGCVEARFADAARTLDALAAAARIQSPFTFYAHLLGAHRGRKKFLSRLGPEANDAIDEFLNLALDYERREAPSLQAFVAWLRAGAIGDQARHGARARRSARDDRPWRQGPRSADCGSRRHHDAARRLPSAETDRSAGRRS